MVNENIEVRPKLNYGLKKIFAQSDDILLISLVTTDGFTIEFVAGDDIGTESDKISAISSTVSAISESTSKELLKNPFSVTIIEADTGNILFVKTTYLGISSVLMMAVNTQKMTLASARYKTRELAKFISRLD